MHSTTFFGVYFDDKLKWKDDISNVCKKTAMCIATLNKVEYMLNTCLKYMCFILCIDVNTQKILC